MEIVVKGQDGETTVSSEQVRLPEGYEIVNKSDYVPRESLKENYVLKETFDRRFKNWTPADKAAQNADVIAAVLAEHGSAPDLETTKKQWFDAEVAPVRAKYDQLTGRLTASELRESASEVFDEKLVKSPVPGVPSFVETAFGSMFKYDESLGYTVATGTDGTPLPSLEPQAGRPYMGVSEKMSILAKDPAWAPYLKADPKNDSGTGFLSNGKGGAVPRGTKRSNMQPKDKAAFVAEHGKDAYLALPE